MAETKTKFTGASVEEYLAARASARQLPDCRRLMAMFDRLTGEPPRMWGPSIVGYGSHRYEYGSGHGGEAPIAAFAIRGADLVVYVIVEEARLRELLSRLGKHKMGKSCLYFRRLDDLDPAVLEELVRTSIAEAGQHRC